ncbi:hypothetical protein FB567DRAFT_471107 [Paraphoma chrysanthemicola]|uniref:Lccl domain-containing protein n=1 Tax=Paraphoma chrysanthemicola TaxID=798071 RepID=A0A8K0VYB6_9PLEO|nr:hypothetical protein FB567DRAFT_471107 [Paraphoma chrysanthemicola]
MAAPASVNIKNLQGKWILNKTLSDSPDPVLALQGIGWLTRKAIGLATVTQHLKQYPTTGADGSPATQIDIDQTSTGGVKGTSEKRTLDWQYRGHTDWLFGTLQGKTRYNTLQAVTEENKGKGVEEEDAKFLVEGWLKETEEGEIVESFVDNDGNKWTGWQIWGFAEINGERRLTRRFAIRRKNKDEVVRIRMTYDWAGEIA